MKHKWLLYLAAPLMAMMLGSALAVGLVSVHVTYVPSGPPFKQSNTVQSGVYNILIIVILMVTMTAIIYALIRYGKIKLFTAMKATLITIMVFSMVAFFTGVFSYLYDIPLFNNAYVLYAFITALSALIVYCALAREGLCSTVSITLYSAMAGTILSITFPPLTLLILPIALIIYDIVMVYKGLLGKLVSSSGEEERREKRNILKGLMVDIGDLGLGVGDLVIYSMIASLDVLVSSSLGPLVTAITVLGSMACVSSGLIITIEVLLPKKGYAPALPIPVALGLIPFIIVIFLG